MSIRLFFAFVLLVGLLGACQASPTPAPSPTAVPTQLPAPTAEPTATVEPATAVPTVTLQPTAEPTPDAPEGTELTLPDGADITLDDVKAAVIAFFGEDNAEEGAKLAASIASIELVPPIEGSEPITGTQIFHGLTVTGTVAVTFTVDATNAMQITVPIEAAGFVVDTEQTPEVEPLSTTEVIYEQLGINDPENPNAWASVYESEEYGIKIWVDNPFPNDFEITSTVPDGPLPQPYIDALEETRRVISEEGFYGINIATGEIKLWTPEELVASGADPSKIKFEYLYTADRDFPTLTPRSTGENFYWESPNQTREAMYSDAIVRETAETGGRWRERIVFYYDEINNVAFTINNPLTEKADNQGNTVRETRFDGLTESSPFTRAFVDIRRSTYSPTVSERVLDNPTSYDTFLGNAPGFAEFRDNIFPLEIKIEPITLEE